jgi:hypothetical protein
MTDINRETRSGLLATGILTGLLAFPAASMAENTASAFTKDGTAVIGAAALRAATADQRGFTKVLETTLKNSGEPKDLIIGLSFETSLFTETVVRSKGGSKSTSTADATIEMYVTVDGVMAAPEEVIFDRRTQTLWAELGGVLDCNDLNGDGIVSFDECTLSDEEIGLILDTTAAHSFNFLAYDIGSGSHTIQAYARVSKGGNVVGECDPDVYAAGECDPGSWDASASLGKGTLAVWEVHGAMVSK